MASKLWSTMESASLVPTVGSRLSLVLFPVQTAILVQKLPQHWLVYSPSLMLLEMTITGYRIRVFQFGTN